MRKRHGSWKINMKYEPILKSQRPAPLSSSEYVLAHAQKYKHLLMLKVTEDGNTSVLW